MSTSDSNYIQCNGTTNANGNNTDDSDSNDSDDSDDKMFLKKFCWWIYHVKKTTSTDILVLTNAIPQFIFFFFCSAIKTMKQGHILWTMSFLAVAIMLPFSMMENYHSIWLVKWRQLNLCLKNYLTYIQTLSNSLQKIMMQLCIASCYHQDHWQTNKTRKLLHTWWRKNVDTLSVQINNGWYPINTAAFCNLPIDIIFYMAKQAPITIVPAEEHRHWNRQKK